MTLNTMENPMQNPTILKRWMVSAALALVMLAAGAMGADDAARDAMDRARLEKMLADGDTGMVRMTFSRYPSRTLPFIDRYLEGGLAMIEKGEPAEQALASFRTGIKFAAIADEAFHETVFTDYANAFASWSPSEQKKFREGQRLFKEAMGVKDDPAKAITMLRQSLNLAASLGDAWGQAMAYSALGSMMSQASMGDDAQLALVKSVELNSRLKLQDDFVDSLMALGRLRQTMAMPDKGVGYFRQAYATVSADLSFDLKKVDEVCDAYIASLEDAGRKDEVEKVRKEVADRKAAQ